MRRSALRLVCLCALAIAPASLGPPADAAAITPMTVGPFVQRQVLSDPAAMEHDQFGHAVALSGDGSTVAVVRLPLSAAYVGREETTVLGPGRVSLYRRDGDGFRMLRVLEDPDPTGTHEFGLVVALSGDGGTLAVGALGTVYLYSAGDGYTTPQALADPSGVNFFDDYGFRVTLSDDGGTVAAGTDLGATVYVFSRAGGAYALSQTIAYPDTAGVHLFGGAVALAGDGATLAVGVRAETNFHYQETVRVYRRDGGGYSLSQTLANPDAVEGHEFGMVMALSGDGTTLAAASLDGLYLYRGGGGGYATPPARIGMFGAADAMALARDGGTLAVGDVLRDSVTVYRGSGGADAVTETIASPGATGEDIFGGAVALSGDGTALAVGAEGLIRAGTVYLYGAAPTNAAPTTAPAGLYPYRLGEG